MAWYITACYVIVSVINFHPIIRVSLITWVGYYFCWLISLEIKGIYYSLVVLFAGRNFPNRMIFLRVFYAIKAWKYVSLPKICCNRFSILPLEVPWDQSLDGFFQSFCRALFMPWIGKSPFRNRKIPLERYNKKPYLCKQKKGESYSISQ